MSGDERAPGIYGIPEAEYFAASYALSCSGCKLLLPPSCPAKFYWRQDHAEYKDVFDFGSGAHAMVLGTGPEITVVDAGDWRTKAAREARDQARTEGRTPLLAAEYQQVKEMAAALRAHPIAYAMFDPRDGAAEQSLFWDHPATGTPLRARLDWLPGCGGPQRPVIADYKTCTSADAEDLSKAVARYGYHIQHAFYSDGVAALTGTTPAFIFVCQEKVPPYLVHVIELDPDAVATGRRLYEQAIRTYRACIKSGNWPGYADGEITEIALPAWAPRGEGYL
jgi:PDDEXK-like domain of unknown function (DUF3799)